ncbi:1-acyl-sn-glycerol-3-phosphate acyltransferase [Aureispira anguillae]|uniref:1-acyl-sn-glycerol-3-phosphate acyltransferase n=1 Tax=Aureispira anguillae TaxID=2864201 RepID=A0A916DWA6_9BACT|nr:1-acyl-sn-glycerol-3-phosphate acyltransferase [Aureispira anguillae]BDS14470.1 1-acyl-sn-glycerol-3-phosphate acyltransferase [Aureispira anguillae]
MILYNLFKFSLWIMYICFFRRVYYLNANYIPKDEPLIFISNHSNGFMDPILIAAMQKRPVYFWARASEFPDNLKGKLMYRLHGLPIYRVEEGTENMHKNEATFKKTRELLYTGWDSAFIAPEGNCVLQKKLLPFKKGCARLAFKMMEEKNWGIDVKILPAGVNYTYHDKFRSEVYTKLGKPLSVLSYKEIYEKDKEEAIAQLTADMRVALRNQMVYIEEGNEALTEKLLVLLRNNFTRGIFPMYSANPELCEAEQQMANYVNELGEEEKIKLEEQVDTYYQNLEAKGANDYAVANQNKRSVFWLMVGLPFWIIGTLVGRIPHILARNLRNKFVPFAEFSTSFAFTAAFFIWIIWGILSVVIGAFFIGWWTLLLPFGMIFFQTYAYHYQDYYKEWSYLTRYKKVKKKDELEQERAGIKCLGKDYMKYANKVLQ